jgi:hypothetical protein
MKKLILGKIEEIRNGGLVPDSLCSKGIPSGSGGLENEPPGLIREVSRHLLAVGRQEDHECPVNGIPALPIQELALDGLSMPRLDSIGQDP